MARTGKGDLPDGTTGFFATGAVTAPITLSDLPKSVFARVLFGTSARCFAGRGRALAFRYAGAGQSAIHGTGESVRIAA
jgi:hypothetical protein